MKIIIQCNCKVVDYLNVTFTLTDSSYCAVSKTNNEIKSLHKQSNQPLSIIKQSFLSVGRRLSKLSSNMKIFNNSIPIYQVTTTSYHTRDMTRKNSQQRKKLLIWFNPPPPPLLVGTFSLSLISHHTTNCINYLIEKI